jgi:hypothetical protein
MLQNWLIDIQEEMKNEHGKEWQCSVLGKLYSLPLHLKHSEILEDLLKLQLPSIQTPSWSRKRKSDSIEDQSPPSSEERDDISTKEDSHTMYPPHVDDRNQYYFHGYPDYFNYYSPYYPSYSQYYTHYYPYQ